MRTVTILDSLAILPRSLRDLCRDYNVENKGIFPYTFAKSENLFYKGTTPNVIYYHDIIKDEYEKLLSEDKTFKYRYNSVYSYIEDTYTKLFIEDWDIKKETIVIIKYSRFVSVNFLLLLL